MPKIIPISSVISEAPVKEAIKPKHTNAIETQPDSNLEARVAELERILETHKHTRGDGSSEFDGTTLLNVKELNITGAGVKVGDFVVIPLNIFDGTTQQQARQRATSMGLEVQGTKDSDTEAILSYYYTGKANSIADVKAYNKIDWEKVNYAVARMEHVPQSEGVLSGTAIIPSSATFQAFRTPTPSSSGTITVGGNTLSDSTAQFETDILVGGVLNLVSAGAILEAHRIISNTTNTITISDFPHTGGGVWATASGAYTYQVIMPIFLGGEIAPFYRLNIGDAIVMGFGNAGSQKRTIKWGVGSPEGVVTANIGSQFNRFDGGAGSTLYIKESGNGTNSGWAAK